MPTAVEKLDWTFTDAAGVAGSGVMRVDTQTGVVLSMSGTYEGKNITFSSLDDNKSGTINHANYSYHPNDPAGGFNTLQNAPNTGGANYTYDDIYNTTANPGTGVDYVGGILISTGAGKTKTYEYISLDTPTSTQVDFFSITNGGATYTSDEGTFSTTPYGSPTAARFTQAVAAFGAGSSVGSGVSSSLATPASTTLALVNHSHHLT